MLWGVLGYCRYQCSEGDYYYWCRNNFSLAVFDTDMLSEYQLFLFSRALLAGYLSLYTHSGGAFSVSWVVPQKTIKGLEVTTLLSHNSKLCIHTCKVLELSFVFVTCFRLLTNFCNIFTNVFEQYPMIYKGFLKQSSSVFLNPPQKDYDCAPHFRLDLLKRLELWYFSLLPFLDLKSVVLWCVLNLGNFFWNKF